MLRDHLLDPSDVGNALVVAALDRDRNPPTGELAFDVDVDLAHLARRDVLDHRRLGHRRQAREVALHDLHEPLKLVRPAWHPSSVARRSAPRAERKWRQGSANELVALVVCRGFGLGGEGGPGSLDLGQDVGGGGGPGERGGVVVPVGGPVIDGVFEIGDAGEDAVA